MSETIPYDDATREGRNILARRSMRLWWLAEIIFSLPGDRTLTKFARAIKSDRDTVLKYRRVYEKFDALGKVGTVDF
jgi:hypothetical protein